jgi:peptidoglycan/LPS O-acetylase OafA/YrhL
MPTAPAAAYTDFRTKSRFGSLDGLRAASVAAVIWHHTGGGLVTFEWFKYGHHGVTLFFAISGFLITTLLLREHDRHGTIDLRAFYIRRSLRIFPLYYAVLLVYGLLVFLLERQSKAGQEFFANLPSFATYTSNWFVALDGRTIFYFAWSLAAEEQFYLIWPPLLKKLGTRARALAVAASVTLLVAAFEWALPLFIGAARAEPIQMAMGNLPLAIVAGVVGALLLHDPKTFARCWPWLAGSRWHSLAWLVLALLSTYPRASPWATSHLALAGLVMSCCMREDHLLAGLLRWRPMVYLGTISYGLYLLHMLCKNVVVKAAAVAGVQLGAGAFFLATLALAIVAAGLSFKYFESRFLRIKGRFERSTSPGLRTA